MNARLVNIIKNIKSLIYCIVLIGFSSVHAGSYDDFFRAIIQDNDAKVAALLQRGFDPNTVDPSGTPGLVMAIKLESTKVSDLLIRWPTTKVEVRNPADESPLMLAALAGDVNLCRLLIQRDADVNKTGWTPLHYAATHGHLEVMRLLLEENAYIDAGSPNGSTPLMMAASYGTADAVKLLLEAGADPTLANDLGLKALDFANQANRTDSAEIISTYVHSSQSKGTW